MVYLQKSSSEIHNKMFVQREWISLVLIFVLVVLGNRTSSAAILILAAAFVSFCILKSDIANAFYWVLFLVPNIRMFDGIGISFIVNAIMALPLVVYAFRAGIRRVPAIALLGSICLGTMELFHDAAFNDFTHAVTIMGWILNLLLAMLITVDSKIKFSKDDIFSAFSTGIIMSAVMYLLANNISIMYILERMNRGLRLAAYADDPNYYSLYICLAIASILNVTGKNVYKFCVMFLLVGIGFLTASKMCIMLMAFEFVLIFLQLFSKRKESRNNKRFIAAMSSGLILGLIVLRDYVQLFLNNIVRRMGNINTESFDLDKLTSGRFTILMEYLDILGNDLICFLFGYGFHYHLLLDQSSKKGAHNTYMDLILAWGLLGTIIFVLILFWWSKTFKQSRNIQKVEFMKKIPMIVLLINFLDLSCLSAGMFPIVIAVVMIQCLPLNQEV